MAIGWSQPLASKNAGGKSWEVGLHLVSTSQGGSTWENYTRTNFVSCCFAWKACNGLCQKVCFLRWCKQPSTWWHLAKYVKHMAVGHGIFGGCLHYFSHRCHFCVLIARFVWRCGRSSSRYCLSFSVPSLFSQIFVTGADVVLYNCLVAMCDRIGHWELAVSLAISGCRKASLIHRKM